MKTQTPSIKITAPKSVHIIAWLNPKINYRIVGKNGETLLACQQGFERMSGLNKNLRAVAFLFQGEYFPATVKIYWVLNRSSKKIIEISEVTV